MTRRTPLILIAFIATTFAAYAECLSSAREVWREHPGSHATWRGLPGHEGVKCWFASLSKTKRMVADTSRDDAREVRPLSATAAPLAHPRSLDAPRKTERGPLPTFAKPAVADASRDVAHEIRPVSAEAIPLPRRRSQEARNETERGPLPAVAKPASAGEARSILMWGTPMQIDPTWEDLFTRREQGAE
jgi:hypothetical protein